MSRIAIAFSLVTALTSAAVAAPGFAQPPPSANQPVATFSVDAVFDAGAESAPAMRRMPVLREDIRAMLLQNRAANLARFRTYMRTGSFPSNVYTSSAANVWRDADGKYCAAATIIRLSGHTALVEQIAEDDNFIRLGDVTSGPVMDWILTSGLTQAEIALIQRPFRPVTNRPQLEEPITVAVNPSLRAKETARLAKLYKQIDATLVKNQRASLDAAVERLMKNERLASRLLARHAAST